MMVNKPLSHMRQLISVNSRVDKLQIDSSSYTTSVKLRNLSSTSWNPVWCAEITWSWSQWMVILSQTPTKTSKCLCCQLDSQLISKVRSNALLIGTLVRKIRWKCALCIPIPTSMITKNICSFVSRNVLNSLKTLILLKQEKTRPFSLMCSTRWWMIFFMTRKWMHFLITAMKLVVASLIRSLLVIWILHQLTRSITRMRMKMSLNLKHQRM